MTEETGSLELGGLEIELHLDDLTWGEWEELEEATSFKKIGAWLIAHTSMTEEQRKGLRASELRGLKQRLLDAVWEGLSPKK